MARPTRVIAKHVVATDAISAPWFAICATSTMEAFVATAPPRATLAETLRELRRATRNTHVTCQYTRTHIDAHTHTHTTTTTTKRKTTTDDETRERSRPETRTSRSPERRRQPWTPKGARRCAVCSKHAHTSVTRSHTLAPRAHRRPTVRLRARPSTLSTSMEIGLARHRIATRAPSSSSYAPPRAPLATPRTTHLLLAHASTPSRARARRRIANDDTLER